MASSFVRSGDVIGPVVLFGGPLNNEIHQPWGTIIEVEIPVGFETLVARERSGDECAHFHIEKGFYRVHRFAWRKIEGGWDEAYLAIWMELDPEVVIAWANDFVKLRWVPKRAHPHRIE